MITPIALKSDGLARRLLRVADLFRMSEIGILERDERVELVRGELIPMAAKGARHEILKLHLNRLLGRTCPDDVMFGTEPGWTLDAFNYLEPDFFFYPATLGFADVRGPDALLVIEVSDTSLGYDLGVKAGLYAELGVPEYWVIDAAERVTHVHKTPAPTGYAERRAYPAATRLVPERIPDFAFRLADLPEA